MICNNGFVLIIVKTMCDTISFIVKILNKMALAKLSECDDLCVFELQKNSKQMHVH